MEELSYEELEFMELNKDIIMEKAVFLTNNKDAIVNNLSRISYSLYKVLVSNERLDELKEYKNIINFLNKKDAMGNYSDRDEIYILQTLLGMSDKVSTNFAEKEKARARLTRYNECFEKNKVKMRVYGA